MNENRLRAGFLKVRQALPLHIKIEMTLRRIRAFYEANDGMVYISFSGGADSTVLLFLARSLYPHIPAVFVDTGVEYPEIREFVRTVDNVTWIKPKKTFKQIVTEYGYPVVDKETSGKIYEARNSNSEFLVKLRIEGIEGRKRQQIPAKWKFLLDAPFPIHNRCCHILKKEPLHRYSKATGRKAIIGTMAVESARRTQQYIQTGCFAYGQHPSLRPLSFWTPEDTHSLLGIMPHCVLYDMGFDRTGCMLCCYGVHLNNPNKFQTLKRTHPRIHAKALPAFGINKVLDYVGAPYE